MDIIVGTAGHIDHGKTALVKALTGIDADRLPEEKQRGITIDIGFAEMQVEDVGIGFVDVPGHERFVRNMLAGASGIDLVLLVVAADEGVMPQTREHFDICRLLKIGGGLIALTKTDLADPDMLELARLDVADLVKDSFLENAPVVDVSARTGVGIDDLKSALVKAARSLERQQEIHEARLPIDRSFSVKGFGAVVTGTLGSGAIAEGDELELYPLDRRVRTRGVQTHGRSVETATAGRRTAVNLGGIDHDEVARGMTLAAPGTLTVTQSIDAEIEVLSDAPRPLRSRQRVRINLGTAEVLARVAVLSELQQIEPGSRSLAQLRLETPVATIYGDRFIVRSYSPQRTLGGGRVLNPLAPRHRRSQLASVASLLGDLASGDNIVSTFVQLSGQHGLREKDLRSRTGLRDSVLRDLIGSAIEKGVVVDANGVFLSGDVVKKLRSAMLAAIESHHKQDKLSRGISRETLRERIFRNAEPEVFRAVTRSLIDQKKIVLDQDVFRLATHEMQMSPAESAAHARLRELYLTAGLEAPKLDDALAAIRTETGLDPASVRKLFQMLVNSGELVMITQEFYFPLKAIDELKGKLKSLTNRSLDVAAFKDVAGVSRKYAIPLLEYFDRTHVTRRVGDKREIL